MLKEMQKKLSFIAFSLLFLAFFRTKVVTLHTKYVLFGAHSSSTQCERKHQIYQRGSRHGYGFATA